MNVNAAEISTVTYDMGKIKVSGTAAKESDIKLVITDAGSAVNDINGILAIKEFKSGENGSFIAEVSISEDLKGVNSPENIILSIKEKGTAKAVKPLVYAYRSEINTFVSNVHTSESLKLIFDGAAENEENEKRIKRIMTVMGFSMNQFEQLSETAQGKMLEIYDSNIDLHSCSGSEMVKEFNSMLGLGFINDDNPYGYSLLKAEFSGVEYANITDMERKAYIDSFIYEKLYENYESFYTAYRKANVLYEVNTALSSNLEGIMADYETDLEISANTSYTQFKGFNNYKKGTAIDIIVNDLTTSRIYSSADFVKILEKAVETALKNDIPSDRGPGSSSGGSPGGGKNTVVKTDAPKVEKNQAATFSDFSSNHWAYSAVMNLSEKSVINGYEDGSFRPENSVTRAEFIKMIVTATGGIEKSAQCDFSDVSENNWFYEAVATGYKNKLITGSDGTFRPFDTITRQEAATIIYRRLLGMNVQPEAIRDAHIFNDESLIADYAKNAIDALYKNGIINGVSDSEFKPLEGCTRAQSAMLIYSAFCK
jgi:hypothetical protein